jgi:hypothetical protein
VVVDRIQSSGGQEGISGLSVVVRHRHCRISQTH